MCRNLVFVLLAVSFWAGCSRTATDSGVSADSEPVASGRSDVGSQHAESVPVRLQNGVAELGPHNTRIQFVGTHVGDKPDPRRGGFSALSGKLEFDTDGKTLRSISLEVSTGSLWTNIPQLTRHLKSPDFFDTVQHPTMTFVSTEITAEEGSANRYRVLGDLTMLGTTQSIRFPATVIVGRDEVALRTEFTIDRTRWGMNFGLDQVEKEVELTVVVGEPAGEGPPMAAMASSSPGSGDVDPAELFKRRDTDGDGQLTESEMSDSMRENLAAIDKDGDGAVSWEEFQQRFRELRQEAGNPPPAPDPSPDAGKERSGS